MFNISTIDFVVLAITYAYLYGKRNINSSPVSLTNKINGEPETYGAILSRFCKQYVGNESRASMYWRMHALYSDNILSIVWKVYYFQSLFTYMGIYFNLEFHKIWENTAKIKLPLKHLTQIKCWKSITVDLKFYFKTRFKKLTYL